MVDQKKMEERFLGMLQNMERFGELEPMREQKLNFYQDILFGDTKVSAGTYVLLTIPGENEWEVILSSNIDVWGAFQYNPLFNVVSITVPSNKAEFVEIFSIAFKAKKNIVNMVLAWDATRVQIPIAFNIKEEYAKL